MGVRQFTLNAIASVILSAVVVTGVSTASQLESAMSTATSSSVIRIDANISATVPGTVLNIPGGCTIEESASFSLSGYYLNCQASGLYSTTRIGTVPKRLTIVSPTTNATNTVLGTVHLENGKFVLNANVQGANGGGNKNGNLVSFFTSNNNRVEADIYGNYQTASADCVAIDVGTNPVPSTSYMRAWGCVFRSPGTGSSDNWFTNHGNCSSYAIACDFANPGTTGPGINSAPVNSTMEIYGGQIDMTGSAGTTSSDLFLTRLVGVKIIGTSSNNIKLVADSNKSKPSYALRCQSSINILASGVHALSPIWAEIELTTADKYIGVISSGTDYVGPSLWMAKIKGTCNSGSTSVIWLKGDATIYNLTSNHTSVTNSVAVRYGYSSTSTVNIYRASINSAGALNIAFATRNDMANTTVNIINSKVKAGAGGYTNSVSGAAFNLVGTTLTDTEPTSALTGWLNESPELAADATWVKVKAFLNTCPALPGDTSLSYPTNSDNYI
jgi:hypothetical protein